MTRDVLVTISGNQMMGQDQNHVEMITPGDYFQEDGCHYVTYNEVMEGFEGTLKSVIKISPGGIDIIKEGVANVHMIFEESKKNIACYATPFGDMTIGINTNQIRIDEGEDSLKVHVDYSLDINYEHVSDCMITVDVRSRSKADIHLQS